VTRRGARGTGAAASTTRVDLHVKTLDERVVRRAKARGLDVLVYAPHFTRLPEIRDRARRYSDDDLLVVPAREVFTGSWRDRRHVLAVGLVAPVPDFVTLAGCLDELDRQAAATLVPHPELLTVSLDRATVEANADRIDAVEGYNAKCLPHQNRRARAVVRAAGLPSFASSYAHLRRTVGEAWTEFDRPIRSTADLVAALREGAPRRLRRRGGAGHRLRGAVEFAHLGYENTVEKLDRVVLSGTEPTHPRHPAYDGRFVDVAVY
jgi:predicted metal-dependent phosphoesterase TrpH